jgi:hypothetical protein
MSSGAYANELEGRATWSVGSSCGQPVFTADGAEANELGERQGWQDSRMYAPMLRRIALTVALVRRVAPRGLSAGSWACTACVAGTYSNSTGAGRAVAAVRAV